MSGIEALDYLINNVDRVRNLGNYMIRLGPKDEFRGLVPIDQELSFTSTRQRAIVYGKTGMMPTQWTRDLAERVAALHANPAAFVTKIRPLVGDDAVGGVIKRLGELYDDGVRRGAIVPAGPAPQPSGVAVSGPGTLSPAPPALGPAQATVAGD
jgi:hypothetical protein